MVASKVLGEAMRQELIPMHIFTSVCLKTILQLLESKDTGKYSHELCMLVANSCIHAKLHITMILS